MLRSIGNWFSKSTKKTRKYKASNRRQRRFRPDLESLECRLAPALTEFIWEGDVSDNWETAANWLGGAKPAWNTPNAGDVPNVVFKHEEVERNCRVTEDVSVYNLTFGATAFQSDWDLIIDAEKKLEVKGGSGVTTNWNNSHWDITGAGIFWMRNATMNWNSDGKIDVTYFYVWPTAGSYHSYLEIYGGTGNRNFGSSWIQIGSGTSIGHMRVAQAASITGHVNFGDGAEVYVTEGSLVTVP